MIVIRPACAHRTMQRLRMSDQTRDEKSSEIKDTIRIVDKDHYLMESFEIVDVKSEDDAGEVFAQHGLNPPPC